MVPNNQFSLSELVTTLKENCQIFKANLMSHDILPNSILKIMRTSVDGWDYKN